LWDKSGQPDPEIQKLEEILGTLRYQPRPLELPVPRRRSYFPLLAIAASVLLALLAAGVWLRVRNQSAPQPQEAKVVSTPSPVEEKKPEQIVPKVVPQEVIAVNHKHRHRPAPTALSKREREEALLAKQQLMMALRLTTEKLSLVHRKPQNTTPANQIKNQHRVG
jgi:negative regulator of sigma E activity